MRVLAVSVLAAAVVGCNPFAMWGNATTKRDVAEKATARFHAMIDSAQFEAIWNEADLDLQNSGPQEDAIALFRMVNRRFGQVQGTDLKSWNVNFSTSEGTLVRLVYRTGFARDSATETFVWRIRDNKPALLNYNINSPALLRAMVEKSSQ